MRTLHESARAGELEEIRQHLLARPTDLESRDDAGRTPLMCAVENPEIPIEVVRFLIEQKADVNATSQPEQVETNLDFMAEIPPDLLDPELLEDLKAMDADGFEPDREPVLQFAAKHARIEVVRLLIDSGADLSAVSNNGYDAFIASFFRETGLDMELLKFLVEAGAPLNRVTSFGESALSLASSRGESETIRFLLENGADPKPLEWNELFHTIALGGIDELRTALEADPDLTQRDRWHRTPFLFCVQVGDPEKAELLLNAGSDIGEKGQSGDTALIHAVRSDRVDMLEWLLSRGCSINETNEHNQTALIETTEYGADACFHLLMDAGADTMMEDEFGERIASLVTKPEQIRRLMKEGGDPVDFSTEAQRILIGLGPSAEMNVPPKAYKRGRVRRFGRTNPEEQQDPFQAAMVRLGWSGWQAGEFFRRAGVKPKNPVWCHARFGMSLTALPDGRFVQIGGEHEDHYDPDFCIYNDVFVHDGAGAFQMFGYPEKIFPPTDFHTATLVDEGILIIGSLGYDEKRAYGKTPVYRLELDTWKIEKVETGGETPGWIHRHKATLEDGAICLSGGEVCFLDGEGLEDMSSNPDRFRLDLETLTWTREESA